MNTRYLEEEIQKREPDLAPYKLSDTKDQLKVNMTISYTYITACTIPYIITVA